MNALTNYVCDMMLEHFESNLDGLSYSERKEVYESIVDDGVDGFESVTNEILFSIYEIDGEFKNCIIDAIDYGAAYNEMVRQLFENYISTDTDSSDSE